MSPQLTRIRLIVLAWAVLALLFAVHNVLVESLSGTANVRAIAWTWILCSVAWGMLTPVVLALSRVLPLRSGAWLRPAALHVLASAVISLIALALYAGLHMLVLSGSSVFRRVVISDFHVGVCIYAAIVALDQASRWQAEALARATRTADVEAALARTRLEVLRNRLQPHFLFNALNGVSVLMFDDVEAAHRMLLKLGELLRISINVHQQREISLEDELETAELYVAVERIRLADRLDVQIDVAPDALDLLVPPFLLQPLVENAIRHGIEPKVGGGTISIRARTAGTHLVLEIADDGNGGESSRGDGFGLGLSTTEARLTAMYGADHRLELLHHEHGSRVLVSIPLAAEARNA
jgi:hypothetical protein